MKKHLLLFFLAFVVMKLSFAQEEIKPCTTPEYKWGVGVQVNTVDKFVPYENDLIGDLTQGAMDLKRNALSFGLRFTYYITEDKFLKFKAGMINTTIDAHYDTRYHSNTVSYSVGDTKANFKRYYFIAGFGWNIIKKNKINIESGIDIPFIIYPSYKYESNATTYTDSTYSKVDYIISDNVIIPSGFSIGAGAFTELKINLSKHILIGTEFSSALLYSKFKGDVETIWLTGGGTNFKYFSSIQDFGTISTTLSFSITYLF